MNMHHYTDRAGYNAIRALPVWRFLAQQPPGNHPVGAYFTTLAPGTRNLALRLRVPKEKTGFVFEFTDAGDLIRLPGGRGQFFLYALQDYEVEPARQVFSGAT